MAVGDHFHVEPAFLILSRMRPELADSATALTKTGNDYAHTDQRNAARLDQAYPSVKPSTGKGRPV